MEGNVEVDGDKWKSLNFTLLLEEMANSINLMVQSRKRSLESKKQLAEHTKIFQRQISTSDHVPFGASNDEEWNELLKEYQLEIDTLSRRAKQAETSFNKLYELLKPLPDPVTFIQSTDLNNVMKIKDDEIGRLHNKLNDLESEFSTLTNQAVTVRKLREALNDKDNDINNKIDEALIKQEKDFIKRMENNKLEYEKECERLYNELVNERQNIKVLNERIKSKDEEHIRNNKITDDTIQALMAENDTLSSDIDRLTAEIQTLNIEIKLKGNNNEVNNDVNYKRLVDELEYERERCETLNKEMDELNRVNKEYDNIINNMTERENKLKEELIIKERDISMANEQVKRLKHVKDELEKCKSKLNVMEIVEYNANPAEGTTDLEIMLLGKVRSLEGQLAPLRAKLCDYDDIKVKLEEKVKEIHLLKDLLEKGSGSADGGEGGDGGGGLGSMYQHSIPYSKEEGTPSLLDITKQQRDHLKSRVLSLEAERDTLRIDISEKCRKCDKLYNDNIKLLEQKKYWQSMSSSGNNMINVKHRKGHIVNSDDDDDDDDDDQGVECGGGGRDVEMIYMPAYNEEVILSPYDTFKNNERQKRLMALPKGERIIVQVLTIMVGNRFIRIITGIYLVALHMLVFIVLYKLMRISLTYDKTINDI